MAIIGFRFPATSKYHPLGIDSFSPSTEKFRNWYPAEISAFGVDCAEAGTATHTSVTQSASIRTETRDMQLLLCRRHGGWRLRRDEGESGARGPADDRVRTVCIHR